jgi:peptide deformylase
MVKRILSYNNKEDKEILTQKSEEVKDINEIKELIEDLKDTLRTSVVDARGISAVQIGELKRVCLCKWDNRLITMINPIITRTRGNQLFTEGCLSVPGVYKDVRRPQKVWCSYMDENGNMQEIAEGGRMSDIIQHEIDHMDGVCLLYEELEERK